MSDQSYTPGELVWAKIKGYRHWPAVICQEEKKSLKRQQKVRFLGSHDFAVVSHRNILPNTEEIFLTAKKSGLKSVSWRKALDEVHDSELHLRLAGIEKDVVDDYLESTDSAMEEEEPYVEESVSVASNDSSSNFIYKFANSIWNRCTNLFK
ncbi:hypothetical protein JTE90_015991 [Oedothorax gibbosus]|uniref:PWWP domain-containing protein n=1 Tax=Oedothorax gibbosus TaxID=931172 RepID=A0AAV6VSV3_9ARAC|nr:hypothetical protein JTE90_015991 [Oedothorax gibbosus]